MSIKEIKFIVVDITLKGGVERFVSTMSSVYSAKGFKVVIYSLCHTHQKPFYDIPSSVEIVHLRQARVDVIVSKWDTFWGCVAFFRASRRFSGHYTVISAYPSITIFLGLISRKLLRHVIASEHSTYLSHGRWVRALRLFFYKWVKNIVTPTEDGKRFFREAGLPAVKIPNPCTEFEDGRQWMPPQDRSAEPFRCLSVARFEKVKQLDHYVEVARLIHEKCPDVLFDLVGAGPQEKALRTLVQKHCMEDYFRIHGPTKNVGSFYSKAAAYVVTSSSEAFPMTVIEALSYGVPILSYDGLVGPQEIVRDDGNGFLCRQNSPKDVADKIILLRKDDQKRRDLSSQALETARLFKRSEVFRRWSEIL